MSVLPEPTQAEVRLNDRDLMFKTCRGSGAGGQHRNTTDSAVQLTHRPTGITVRVEGERSQHRNKEAAKSLLRARIAERLATEEKAGRDARRRAQVGTAERSDKVFTVSRPRNSVICHKTGKRTSYKRYLRGFIEDLW